MYMRKLTRLRKSALNVMELEANKTRLSSPIFGKARSATAMLNISLRPYRELNITSSVGEGSLRAVGNRMETQAMREPSVLYLEESSKARVLIVLKGSFSPLLADSTRYMKIYKNKSEELEYILGPYWI